MMLRILGEHATRLHTLCAPETEPRVQPERQHRTANSGQRAPNRCQRRRKLTGTPREFDFHRCGKWHWMIKGRRNGMQRAVHLADSTVFIVAISIEGYSLAFRGSPPFCDFVRTFFPDSGAESCNSPCGIGSWLSKWQTELTSDAFFTSNCDPTCFLTNVILAWKSVPHNLACFCHFAVTQIGDLRM